MNPCRLLALLGPLLLAGPGQAFELARGDDGAPLAGVALPVHLQVQLDDDLVAEPDRGPLGARAAAWRAALRWEAPVVSALHFARWLPGDPDPGDNGAQVTVRAADPWPPELGSPLATVAFTLVTVDEEAGRIASAEILINAEGFAYSTSDAPRRLDVEACVSHELGHAVGLEHPCGEPWGTYPDCTTLPDAVRAEIEAATMYPAASAGNLWQRDLADDDKAALAALYGGGSPAPPPALEVACACAGGQVCLDVELVARAPGLALYADDARHAVVLEPAACAADAATCLRRVAAPAGLAGPVDVELTDGASGKRATVFEVTCPRCPAAGVEDEAASGCHCGMASGLALLLPWQGARRRMRCQEA